MERDRRTLGRCQGPKKHMPECHLHQSQNRITTSVKAKKASCTDFQKPKKSITLSMPSMPYYSLPVVVLRRFAVSVSSSVTLSSVLSILILFPPSRLCSMPTRLDRISSRPRRPYHGPHPLHRRRASRPT